jgi:hypothetical protein
LPRIKETYAGERGSVDLWFESCWQEFAHHDTGKVPMNLFGRKNRLLMQTAIAFLSAAFGAYAQRQPSNAPADLVF